MQTLSFILLPGRRRKHSYLEDFWVFYLHIWKALLQGRKRREKIKRFGYFLNTLLSYFPCFLRDFVYQLFLLAILFFFLSLGCYWRRSNSFWTKIIAKSNSINGKGHIVHQIEGIILHHISLCSSILSFVLLVTSNILPSCFYTTFKRNYDKQLEDNCISGFCHH